MIAPVRGNRRERAEASRREKGPSKDRGKGNLAPYGICHADELYLLFYPFIVDYVPAKGLNQADTRVSNTILELWKNFIKHGNASSEGTCFLFS